MYPSAIQDALPSLELEAKTNPPSNTVSLDQESVHATGNTLPIPLEAFMEPPTRPERDNTSTPTDNYELGSSRRNGHIADGTDEGMLTQDSSRTKQQSRKPLPLQEGRSMTAPLQYVALDQSPFLSDTEEWPQLPGHSAQDRHGPSLKPTAMPRESSACNPIFWPLPPLSSRKNTGYKKQPWAVRNKS